MFALRIIIIVESASSGGVSGDSKIAKICVMSRVVSKMHSLSNLLILVRKVLRASGFPILSIITSIVWIVKAAVKGLSLLMDLSQKGQVSISLKGSALASNNSYSACVPCIHLQIVLSSSSLSWMPGVGTG